MKKAVSILMVPVISVGLWGCETKPGEEPEYSLYDIYVNENMARYVRTAENVSVEMLKADYWINMQESPGEVIMTEEEIVNWCESYKAMSDGGEYNFYGYDDEDEPESISGEVLREIIEGAYDVPDIKLYDKDGNETTEEFWMNILNNRNMEAIGENSKLRFGYTVARCNMRMVPFSELITTDKESDYFCELQVSSILINEPVIILHESADRQWYYVFSSFCSGWIESKYIGLCEDRFQWLELMKPEEFLMITGDKVVLEEDTNYESVSGLSLYMGTKLGLIRYENYIIEGNDRVPFECYIVKIPVRKDDGMLAYEYGFIPVSRDVQIGYLPYTTANLINQMFKVNGNRYGWGGMYKARDCSQYIMELYRTFGFSFGRNSATQAKMPFGTYDVEESSDEEKKDILNNVPVGSILYFPGHVMMYLGRVDDEYYVISATGRMMSGDEDNENVIYAHTTLVTPLSVRRISGMTWLSALTRIKIIDIKK